VLIAAASNLTLFGQDWVMFLSQPRGSPLAVTSNFWIDPHPLFFYLLVPQAWSVGLELCFYLIVPFVNRLRTITIAAIAAASLIVRLTAYAAFGLDHDPWTYRFFPFEMFSFLLGMLAYRLYVASRGRLPTPAAAATAKGFAVASIAALITFYGAGRLIAELSRHVDIAYGSLLTYPLWALLVAGLFAITRTNTYDRTLGELSFPIYLVHYFVIAVARGALERASLPQFWLGPLSAILSIGIAVVLLKWCIEPIDRARHVLASGGAVTPSILPMTAAGLERPVESA
jgi:peptidoglycan/LPS O-acetylase OafA/YrhL